jgi:hypothetical protein
MDQRHQLRTGSDSTIETDATQKAAAGMAQRIETPEDLIRLDRESITVPSALSTRLAESLQSQAPSDTQHPWWRRWLGQTSRP